MMMMMMMMMRMLMMMIFCYHQYQLYPHPQTYLHATPALKQLAYTGYPSNHRIKHTSCVHWCIKSTLDMHHSTWLTLCSQSLNPVVDPVWGPPTPLTTSNVALELNSVNVASVTLVQLPGIPYLTSLSLPLTLIGLEIF